MLDIEDLIHPRRRGVWPTLALSGVAGLLCWAAWFGWDLHYDVDPVTGAESGPYQPWQVLGSALCLLVLVVIVGLSMRIEIAFGAYALIASAYTLGFCLSAVIQDDLNPDGGASLWPLGAAALLVGAGAGIFATGALVCFLRDAVRRGASRRDDVSRLS